MPSRVPDAIMYNKANDSMTLVRDRMIKNQEKAITGKRVNRPSDDPVATAEGLNIRAIAKTDEQVNSNLEVANSFLNLTDASLGELGDVISRAKELAIQMSSSTNQSEESRAAVGKEVEQLMLRTVQIGNTRNGDRYIFGGYQTDRAPFDADGNYFGDAGHFELEVDRGQRVMINVPGNVAFYGSEQITNHSQELREQPGQDKSPTIPGTLRSPASIEAENKGIDPHGDPKGFAELEKKNGVNVFGVFKDFVEGLKTGDKNTINKSLDGFDGAFKQVIASRAIVGARQNMVRTSQDSLENAKVNNADLLSKAEDADTLQVYSDLSKNENALKASLEINRKILLPSLLDFLK